MHRNQHLKIETTVLENVDSAGVKHFQNRLYSLSRVTGGRSSFNTSETDGSSRRRLVLGIETSCDDTGAAVVDDQGNIVGDALHSQTKIHVELGGVIPPVARDLHKQHIDSVVQEALTKARVSLKDLDAVAVTVEPGLALSLLVGLHHAKMLVQQSGLPLIPIHHMEAHALTARMIKSSSGKWRPLSAGSGTRCVRFPAVGNKAR